MKTRFHLIGMQVINSLTYLQKKVILLENVLSFPYLLMKLCFNIFKQVFNMLKVCRVIIKLNN